MQEQLVSFETAELARSKGYNQNPYNTKYSFCPTYVDGSEITIKNSLFSPENNVAVAPTQSLLQRWLREVHKLVLWIYPSKDNDYFQFEINHKMVFSNQSKTYELALEAGLLAALKLIK